MILCVVFFLYVVFQPKSKEEALCISILTQSGKMLGFHHPALPCDEQRILTRGKYNEVQHIFPGDIITIDSQDSHAMPWKFNTYQLKAMVLDCSILWECVFNFFQILALPLALPLYAVWGVDVFSGTTLQHVQS